MELGLALGLEQEGGSQDEVLEYQLVVDLEQDWGLVVLVLERLEREVDRVASDQVASDQAVLEGFLVVLGLEEQDTDLVDMDLELVTDQVEAMV